MNVACSDTATSRAARSRSTGAISGSVTVRSTYHGFAPSRRATAYSSSGSSCRAASATMNASPTVNESIRMIAKNAAHPSENHETGAMPTKPSSQFIGP